MEFIDYNGKDITNNIVQPVNNLLINGDFQIWQRGESISFNDTATTTNGFKYFADMWCIYFERGVGNNFTLKKVKNGVNVTTNKKISVNQFLMEALDSTKDYTFVVSLNNIIHTLTFKGQETKENEFIKHMSQSDSGKYNRLIIYVNNNDVINYANIFEGNIVYPHIKEDYSIALLRSQKKIIHYNYLNLLITYDYTGGKYIAVANVPKMDAIPIFTHGKAEYWDITGNRTTATVTAKNFQGEWIDITFQISKDMNPGNTTILLSNVTLSCEPY